MSALDFLTQGQNPPSSTNNAAVQQTLPDWYNNYIQGIASKATDIASQPYQNYPGAQVADFNDDQQNAFQGVRDNQGSYQPALSSATSTLNGAQPQVQGALGAASNYIASAPGAVAGPAQAWTDPGTAAAYMSPYTQSVTDEIARLGNQNLNENLIPQVQSQFVGSGQFGSSRNADVLSHTIRDAQTNISGLQSAALQSGYTGAETAFNNDANREQTQGQLQANTGIAAGNASSNLAGTGASSATGLAAGQGALGSLQQQLGYNDSTSLAGVGSQEQNLEQTGDTAGYNNFLNQQNYDWTQLGKVQGAVQGAQLPAGATSSTNTTNTAAGYGTSPLGYMSALTGLYNATSGGS